MVYTFFYQCSRSNIPDELCPQLSKTGCLQCYSGKCFQTPPFFYLFAVTLRKNCSRPIHKRWFLINVPNWISMANIFFAIFSSTKTSVTYTNVKKPTEFETQKQNISLHSQQQQKPHTAKIGWYEQSKCFVQHISLGKYKQNHQTQRARLSTVDWESLELDSYCKKTKTKWSTDERIKIRPNEKATEIDWLIFIEVLCSDCNGNGSGNTYIFAHWIGSWH